MNGNALSADEIRSIARLPSREVLHGQLVGTIAAPLSGLVRTLNALLAGVAVQLQQLAEQGLVSPPSSEATSAEPDAAAETEEETRVASDADETQPEAAEAEQPPAAQTTETEPEDTSDGDADAKEE
jgi:large subunit ribosomal protein L10